MGENLKEPPKGMCCVVTVLPCATYRGPESFWKESPEGCSNCGMLEWLGAFETEDECNAAFIKQHPQEFVDGVYKTIAEKAGVAQSVEHLPCKQGVGGSNPSAGSNEKE